MTTDQYIALQGMIEAQEKAKATGKLILFFENGVLKGVETTNKIKMFLITLDKTKEGV
jgi:hypothetical protein